MMVKNNTDYYFQCQAWGNKDALRHGPCLEGTHRPTEYGTQKVSL